MSKPRAVTVCVDYGDYLSRTLPANRDHFSDYLVVTTRRDSRTQAVARSNECSVHCTDSFYAGGAEFNKWAALEEGLTAIGRRGWLAIVDADVVWPRDADCSSFVEGSLYTPFRRMMLNFSGIVPDESEWSRFDRHRIASDFSGYSQIFHADDPVLGPAPWHDTRWKHAGGADTFFQMKWKPRLKVRPGWEVLHLGQPGSNWCGRVTRDIDTGLSPEDATKNADALMAYMRGRKSGSYDHEKL